MALKSKKELKKLYREKYKELFGKYPEPKFNASNGLGKMAKFSKWIVNGKRSITNQKGAFGKRKIHPTFDSNETNHMRHKRMKEEALSKKRGNKSIMDGARGLLTKVLGE